VARLLTVRVPPPPGPQRTCSSFTPTDGPPLPSLRGPTTRADPDFNSSALTKEFSSLLRLSGVPRRILPFRGNPSPALIVVEGKRPLLAVRSIPFPPRERGRGVTRPPILKNKSSPAGALVIFSIFQIHLLSVSYLSKCFLFVLLNKPFFVFDPVIYARLFPRDAAVVFYLNLGSFLTVFSLLQRTRNPWQVPVPRPFSRRSLHPLEGTSRPSPSSHLRRPPFFLHRAC